MSSRLFLAGVLVFSVVGLVLAGKPQPSAAAPDAEDPFSPLGTDGDSEPAVATPTRIWVDSDPDITESVVSRLRNERLEEPVTFTDDVPLVRVFQRFEEVHGIAVVIDELALEDLGIAIDEPINRSIPAGVTLREAIRMVLEPLECVVTVRGSCLTVTSYESAITTDYLAIAVYPVHDLLHDGSYVALLETIFTAIDVDLWARNGGAEGFEAVPFPQRGALIVSSTLEAHEKIAGLLRALRRVSIDPNSKPYERPLSTGGSSASSLEKTEYEGGGFGIGVGGGSFSVVAPKTQPNPTAK